METAPYDDTFWNEFMNDLDATTTEAEAAFNIPLQADPAHSSYAIHESAFAQPSTILLSPITAPLVAPQYAVGDEDLRRAMDALVSRFPHVSLARFKKEAGNAWRRKYPDSSVPMREFQAFVKDNIKAVRSTNPNASHAEHMRAVGSMWRETKKRKNDNSD
jgi:hypothetical protein